MKSRKKKLLKIYIVIIPIIIIIFFLISKNIILFLKYRDLDMKKEQVLSKIESEKKKEEELKKDMKFLETKKGQERILIEKSNLKKPGENVIKILDY